MNGLFSYLRRGSRPLLMLATLLAVVLVGTADYLPGYEISFSLFYFSAISVAVWFIGWRFALVISAFSVACWLVGDLAAGAKYANRFVPGWNAAITLAFYVVMAGVLSNLRSLQDRLEAKVRERTVALTDEMAKRETLEKELLAVIEREQRRIGHDLHDSLCQHLTGTALAGKVLGEKLATKGLPEEVDAGRIVSLVEEGITLARQLARGLAPVELEAEGLAVALGEFAQTTSTRFKIECLFDAPHPAPIDDPATAVHLFRIAQEATANALRHGQARQVVINLSAVPEGVRLSIKDDGCGLPDRLEDRLGMGLHIMRHRAAMIGASFAIRRETQGTLVTCLLEEPAVKESA